MIDIKGIKVPESLFSAIDKVYEESKGIYEKLPNDALELLDKNRVTTKNELENKNKNQKPKI